MKSTAIVVVGDSHYAALSEAAAMRKAQLAAAPPEPSSEPATLFVFEAWVHRLLYPFITESPGGLKLNDAMRRCVSELIDGYDHTIFVSMFGGNHNHSLTLLQHASKFDVSMQEYDDGDIQPDHEIISQTLIKEILSEHLFSTFKTMERFKEEISFDRYIHIDSPACVGDDEWIMNNLGDYFKEMWPYDTPISLTNKATRQKVKLLQSQIYQHKCDELGYEFAENLSSTADANGFLKEMYYGKDPTHANAAYGENLIQSLEAEIGKSLQNYEFFDCAAENESSLPFQSILHKMARLFRGDAA